MRAAAVTSMPSSSTGASTMRAPWFRSAETAFVNPGASTTATSPGRMSTRQARSTACSAPAVTMTCSASTLTPRPRASAAMSSRSSGSPSVMP